MTNSFLTKGVFNIVKVIQLGKGNKSTFYKMILIPSFSAFYSVICKTTYNYILHTYKLFEVCEYCLKQNESQLFKVI